MDSPKIPKRLSPQSPASPTVPTSELATVPLSVGETSTSELPTMAIGVDASGPTQIAPSVTAAETVTMQAGIAAPQANKTRQPPEIIAGYRRLRVLGAGGMAQVFEAEHTTLGRRVALKLLKPAVADSADFSLRFIRESHAMAQVKHDNVVAIYDAGEADGFMYMALELVTGSDLHKILKRRGRLPVDDAIGYMIGCAKGLDAIHAAGLVHRDIKPANIFVDRDDQPKIGDLGLARAADGEDRMTMTGTSWGTPSYMSPEQIKGVADLDIRADIYSLGATLYTLLAGVEPYVGETSYVITHKVLTEPPPDPRTHDKTLPSSVVAVIAKAMAKEREKRYQTPGEFLEDLERLRGGQRLLHTVPVAVSPEISRAEIIAATLPGTRVTTGANKAAPSIDPFVVKVIAMLVVAGVLVGVWYSMQGLSFGTGNKIDDHDTPAWATQVIHDANGKWAEATVFGVPVRLRYCSAGVFTMGSPDNEPGRQAFENSHQVTLSKAYWMLESEVSQLLYQAVMGQNPSSRVAENLPVEGLSWHEAQQFCAKLKTAGIAAQLPTEAQWEYACRAGSNGAFSAQPTPNKQGWMAPPELATIWRDSANDPVEAEAAAMRWISQRVGEGDLGIQPIATLAPNAFGLSDMHGNIMEWCRDAWDGQAPYSTTPVSDPENTTGGLSIVRGGCWFYPPERCRAAHRQGLRADSTLNYVGFRFVVE
jgi:eukaryotic-like serine/threonine-protein kinase